MVPASSPTGAVAHGGGGGVVAGLCGGPSKAVKVKRRSSRSNPVDVATAVELIIY